MFIRFFTGDYNATTSLIVAFLINVLAVLALMFIGMFFWIPSLIAFFAVVWGLLAAARNPVHPGFSRFMCVVFAGLQIFLILKLFGVV